VKTRVVVTGLGVCSSIGSGIEPFWDALIHGRSGIGPITRFDASNLRSRIAGEVRDFDPAPLAGSRVFKRAARFTQLGMRAAYECIRHAGLADAPDREQAGVVIGSGIGGFDYLMNEHQVFLDRGPGKFNPLTVPMIIPNMAAAAVAMETGCGGPNLCPSTACAAGAHAIGMALDLIRDGRAEWVLAGGAECTLDPFAVDGYCQLRALSTRNDTPETASRPFSIDRDGFVLAEGAALLALESEAHARARGARVLAELAGFGLSSDAHHVTAPDPEGRGAVRAMRAALEDASLGADQIDVINAHGTSTPLNDVTETRAIRQVFGAHADHLAVHSTKSMTGHALGASGAIEAVAAVLTLQRGILHPTTNLMSPDPACDLDYVPNVARHAGVRHVLSNSFGFGGHNGVLVFARADR
jgi:3-oxoacyl-[acyl-carrier-protein] synthase II